MQFRPFFSERFKNIRQAHHLGIRDVSALLNVKSSGNITSWEQQKLIPSLDMLNNIISNFAVSADWLLGYSDELYNKKVISTIEKELLSKTIELNGINIPIIRKVSWIPDEYWDYELRDKTYSLAVRANIIFLLHIYINNEVIILEERLKREASSELVNKIMDTRDTLLRNTTSYKIKTKQFDLYMQQLQQLLAAKNSAKPIFDIEAQKTTEE